MIANKRRSSPTLSLRAAPKSSVSSEYRSIMSKAKYAMISVALALLPILLFARSMAAAALDDSLSMAELQHLVERLRGDDDRLVRWDATRHTRRERNKGACQDFPLAMQQLVASTDKSNNAIEWQVLACEYATFCITDNPTERQRFAEVDSIHQATVQLLSSKSSLLSAAAAHVIYIGTFANKTNQQGFYKAGAVEALNMVLKSDTGSPLQLMWAAAAIQNLAASYCDTPGNGRCSWEWSDDEAYVTVEEDVISDGSSMRKSALSDTKAVTRLVQLACHGPVRGKTTHDNPFPGENAVAGKHDEHTNIVAWAAAGALKNLALEPEGASLLRKDVVCFCRLAHSQDWLEQNKGEGVLHHTRRADPCWFDNDGNDYQHGDLCIDREFLDEEGYRCDEYGEATAAECKAVDVNDSSLVASVACCGCGGGDRYVDSLRQEL